LRPVPELFEKIGGAATCRKLSKAFYARVERDPVLRPLFPGKNLRCAIEAFSAFLVQFLGGPSDDSQHRWFLSLQESHRRFAIDERHRAAWMGLMRLAMDDVAMAEPARAGLLQFFEHSSAYLIDRPAETPQLSGELRKLSGELGQRWDAQQALDGVVAAVRAGDAGRAIGLAGTCDRGVLPGVLALMIASGHGDLLAYVHQRLVEEPSLIGERYAGRTLLHNAAGAGSLPTLELLLKLGADPNALDGGRHAPLYSVGNECAGPQSAKIVHALARAGAEVNAHDGATGSTALHMAARRGNAVVAQALIDCGANVSARDTRGDTPLQRALNCRKPHVAELLRSYGRR
jgi:truncated hemoglobin YjbI